MTVLIITTVGLLFGAGALLLFRNQCQLRIDRQHELEKIYAVRSVLNHIRVSSDDIGAEKTFHYYTKSGRDLGLVVKPVTRIFPCATNASHFVMERGDFKILGKDKNQYDDSRFGGFDYEYGAISNGVVVTNLTTVQVDGENKNGGAGLVFSDLAATNTRWWVNIGMSNTGGWREEAYGRRFFFYPRTFVSGTSNKDLLRFCLIRNVTNQLNQIGCRHGWPLSQEDEMALVFEIRPKISTGAGGATLTESEMSIYECVYKNGAISSNSRIDISLGLPQNCPMGLQIANDGEYDVVSLVYSPNEYSAGDTSISLMVLQSKSLTPDASNYFNGKVLVGGKEYGGIFTNAYGKVCAPELRAVFEVESRSDSRPYAVNDVNNINWVTDFSVTPAYQYDIYLAYPTFCTNLATVAQKVGKYENKYSDKRTMITYDTHGTEHKGFRKDERDWAREQLRKNGK